MRSCVIMIIITHTAFGHPYVCTAITVIKVLIKRIFVPNARKWNKNPLIGFLHVKMSVADCCEANRVHGILSLTKRNEN